MEEKDHLSVTGDSDSNTVTLDISGYGAAQPTYYDMSSTGANTTGSPTISIDTIDLGGLSSTGTYTISNSGTGMQWSANQWSTNTVQAATISTANGSVVDIDELAELIKVLKERLLVITPNFEMHEKYPMLKELYDEYKALEKLLSGPDRDIEDKL